MEPAPSAAVRGDGRRDASPSDRRRQGASRAGCQAGDLAPGRPSARALLPHVHFRRSLPSCTGRSSQHQFEAHETVPPPRVPPSTGPGVGGVGLPAPQCRNRAPGDGAGTHASRALPLAPAPDATPPEGPTFDRAALEVLAGGRISSIFGPLFEPQDRYPRQVRMPEPPLLLADRVTRHRRRARHDGHRARSGRRPTCTADSWYLHDGRMPAGLMVESGQADLLLISWLGVDLLNKGERVYRLLGCELTYHGELARPGETLRYDIHVDGHASQGDVRLFFFHYDCRVGGELRAHRAQRAGGLLHGRGAAPVGRHAVGRRDATPDLRRRASIRRACACARRSFSAERGEGLRRGAGRRLLRAGFERARTHVRTPRIQAGRMLSARRGGRRFEPARRALGPRLPAGAARAAARPLVLRRATSRTTRACPAR